MGVSDNIKKLRKDKKITQKQLADLIGKKEITVRKYESGSINPGLDVLISIASALNVDLYELIGNEDNLSYSDDEKQPVNKESIINAAMTDVIYRLIDSSSKILNKENLIVSEYSNDLLELTNNINDLIVNKFDKIENDIKNK